MDEWTLKYLIKIQLVFSFWGLSKERLYVLRKKAPLVQKLVLCLLLLVSRPRESIICN